MSNNQAVNDNLMRHLTCWMILDTRDSKELTTRLRDACTAVQEAALALFEARDRFKNVPRQPAIPGLEGHCQQCGRSGRSHECVATDYVVYHYAARINVQHKIAALRAAQYALSWLLRDELTALIPAEPDKWDINDEVQILQMNFILARNLAWAAFGIIREIERDELFRQSSAAGIKKLVNARYKLDTSETPKFPC